MIVIAGCIIEKDNKILMVQESKEKCYGQWNFPAGHVDEGEKITDAAVREVLEETGYKVKLTGVLPICYHSKNTHLSIKFTAEVLEDTKNYDKNEILDVKWIDIENIKNMKEKELRGYELNRAFLKYFEEKNIYPLEIFDEANYE